jgi:hypothetical protein
MSQPAPQSATETEVTLLLAEYDQVKGEQRGRIQHRDGLVYSTLAAMAAVIAATIGLHTAAVLLLLPPVAIVLGWKYLANDEKIGTAGGYVRDRIAPRLVEITGVTGTVFGWETGHQAGVFRRTRRYVQLAVDLITFCALPFAALVGFWVLGPCPAGLIVVSVLETLLLGGLGWLVAQACLGSAR